MKLKSEKLSVGIKNQHQPAEIISRKLYVVARFLKYLHVIVLKDLGSSDKRYLHFYLPG